VNINKNKPNVLILSGSANTLSITRSLGRQKIVVRIAAEKKCAAFNSKYCHEAYPASDGIDIKEFWRNLLLSETSPELVGSVIFACSDDALQFMSTHKSELEKIYILDDYDAELHLDLLDKQKTLKLAEQVGCLFPKYWNVKNHEDMIEVENDIPFPVIIKPILSHEFQKQFYGKKFFLVNDFNELAEKATLMFDRNLEFMLVEVIPGPDDLLSSYFTYLDKNKKPLFYLTKRCVRRYPIGSGIGTYQITEWLPETAEEGRKFFNGIDFKGMGHVEFKRDLRDGKLKIIECNPRFSAAQEVVLRSGIDMAYLIYLHLTGNKFKTVTKYKNFVTLWSPILDFKAFKQLQSKNELTFFDWLKNVSHRQAFPFFNISDPMPFIIKFYGELISKMFKKLK
jgi:predicted ATP-grasp superfamily ATP-dependent carboligase